MKDKTKRSPCPRLSLSLHQETTYRHLTRAIVRQTLGYANSFHRLPESEQNLSRQKKWQKVLSREHLTLFKERKPPKLITGTSFDSLEHQRLVDEEWEKPKLLVGVGSLSGSLDDVMYGIVPSDTKRESHGALLTQLDGPTHEEDPYQFLGVQWILKEPPKLLRRLIHSRDFVFIEATGTIVRSNGYRLGFHVRHSVDLNELDPNLADRAVIRGRFSCCTIFRELPHQNQVSVYLRGYVDQRGHLPDALALKVAAKAFLSSWNAVERGQIKKLRWFLNNPQYVTWKRETSDWKDSSSVSRRCGGCCGRKFKKFHAFDQCSLCQAWLCSKCRVFTNFDVENELERRKTILCQSCVGKVRQWPVTELGSQCLTPLPSDGTKDFHCYTDQRQENANACWFRHCKRRSNRSQSVMVEKRTPFRKSHVNTLSQCSTLADSMSMTSPRYAFTYS